MDETDACRVRRARVAEPKRVPVEGCRCAFVGSVVPGKYLNQGRLARPVLAEKRVNLAGGDLKRGVVQRPLAGEGLRKTLHGQPRRLWDQETPHAFLNWLT